MVQPRARKQDLDFQARMEFHKSLRLITRMIGIVLVTALLSIFGYLTVRQLAGRTSFADMTFRVLADVKANKPISEILGYLFGFVGISYGTAEKWLRRRHIQRTAPMTLDRERQFDPDRTSSSITLKGETRPEDR